MKKINLKSILKKTFKKKTKSKNPKKKVKVKIKKDILKKKVGRPKIIKKKEVLVKNSKKKEIKKNNIKNENLKLTKTLDQKPEIIKIKKQGTEKREYKVKDYVVYPKHGVGQILSVSAKKIGGIDVQCYDIKFEKDKAIGLLPINKQSHLRPLSTINQVNKSISILKGKPKIKRSMWSRRAQEYEQKITSGKIYELAEVVRDLNKGDDIMIDQSYSERQLFEKAYERIISEFQIVLNLSLENTQKKLDKALKRNLEKSEQANEKVKKTEIQKQPDQEISEDDNTGLVAENEQEE
ncbi:transcriptional regulator [Candidatus Pelagibacter sp.]|nr:transcriptional regulator [Candidatus Pelagibacter sp.]